MTRTPADVADDMRAMARRHRATCKQGENCTEAKTILSAANAMESLFVPPFCDDHTFRWDNTVSAYRCHCGAEITRLEIANAR